MNVTNFLNERRGLTFTLLNCAVLIGAAVASMALSGGHHRPVYVVLLALLCTSPILMFDRWNGRNVLLVCFAAIYFLYFGMLDLVRLFESRPGSPGPPALLTAGEIAILLGAVAVLAGNLVVAKFMRSPDRTPASDVTLATCVLVGVVLYAAGTYAWWYWSVHAIVRRSVEIANPLGAFGTTMVMLGRLVQPLGILMLAYAYAVGRKRSVLCLLLGVIALQVVLGFISDSKETAMRALILVILVRVLVDGRLPRAWLSAGLLFVVFAFPLFQAYRYEVTGLRHVTNEEAARHLIANLRIAWDARDEVASGYYGADVRGQTFLERASLKGSIEMIVARTGADVAFQHGRTLTPLLAAFIPRLLWPDKPEVAAGQLMNREFDVSLDENVYISPSHLGELYWNFGWPGIVVGMSALGALLAFVGGRWSLEESVTLVRLLVIAITIYALCLRFEGTIATSYAVWLRSLAAVGLLHIAARMIAPTNVNKPSTVTTQGSNLMV